MPTERGKGSVRERETVINVYLIKMILKYTHPRRPHKALAPAGLLSTFFLVCF
jgi:hypothetical protein